MVPVLLGQVGQASSHELVDPLCSRSLELAEVLFNHLRIDGPVLLVLIEGGGVHPVEPHLRAGLTYSREVCTTDVVTVDQDDLIGIVREVAQVELGHGVVSRSHPAIVAEAADACCRLPTVARHPPAILRPRTVHRSSDAAMPAGPPRGQGGPVSPARASVGEESASRPLFGTLADRTDNVQRETLALTQERSAAGHPHAVEPRGEVSTQRSRPRAPTPDEQL